MDILGKTGGLQSISREPGLNDSEAQQGAAALLPAIPGADGENVTDAGHGLSGYMAKQRGMGGTPAGAGGLFGLARGHRGG